MIGGTLVPAGEYSVLHEMQGTNHIMIFKQIGGMAEAKAKCNLVPLNEKAKTTRAKLYREREERACAGRNDPSAATPRSTYWSRNALFERDSRSAMRTALSCFAR